MDQGTDLLPVVMLRVAIFPTLDLVNLKRTFIRQILRPSTPCCLDTFAPCIKRLVPSSFQRPSPDFEQREELGSYFVPL